MSDTQQFLFDEKEVAARAARAAAADVDAEPEADSVAALPEAGHGGADGVGDGPMPGMGGDGFLRRLIDDNFLQYASYVIRDRAIPYIDDGLKPVQRRILWSLHENDDGKFIKVANIVGYSMQYHPHGDASIADALVSLANRRYLIEGQGNFGNIHTGDPAAASRYIECRLTELARKELFNDELTRYVPSYDGRRKEPVTLPCKLPLLLMLGADGIAVGLSTRILPHNFQELLEAQIAILQKKPFTLLPDFQQGGLMDVSEYDCGNGKIKLRAVIEKRKDGALVVRQIPYGSTTESMIGSIEDAARKKKISIRSISDFTAEHIEIEIKLAPNQDQDKAIDALYAFTQCEQSLSSRLMVIRDNRPVQMTVDEILQHNTRQLVDLLRRELELERRKLIEEIHRKTLVQIFIENRIYKRIEECETAPEVDQSVIDGFAPFLHLLKRDLSQADIDMLLEIPIKRISRFDMKKNRKEIGELLAGVEVVESSLKQMVKYAIGYLRDLIKKYASNYPRLTTVTSFHQIEVRELTASELTLGIDREKGYIGSEVKDEPLFRCSSLDRIVLVWADGRYKVIPPPDKLFVDQTMLYCAVADRDRVMTCVYTEEGVTYLKRFQFGGFILNKEYDLVPPGSKILLFADDQPPEIYLRYHKEKRQRINQQVFRCEKLGVKGVKAKGVQMTVKRIRGASLQKPRNWDKEGDGAPQGAFIDF